MCKITSKLGFLSVLLALVSCEPPEKLPVVPSLSWKSADLRVLGDSTAGRRVLDLTVHFTDGDGNVGSGDLDFADTCRLDDYETFLDRYDLYIYYFEKVNGRFVPIPPADSCLPYHNILPNLTPEGQNKTLEGDITTPFDYSNFPRFNADSLLFEIRLEDRAGNSSARISSPAIAVP